MEPLEIRLDSEAWDKPSYTRHWSKNASEKNEPGAMVGRQALEVVDVLSSVDVLSPVFGDIEDSHLIVR